MAGESLRQRHHTLVTALILIIISTILLSWARLGPTSLSLFPHLAPQQSAISSTTDKTNAMGSKHGKEDDAKKKKKHRTYPQVSTLPAGLLPAAPSDSQDASRRLIVIGDVHGHLKALEELLKKAEFSASRGDTVIFAGDMVNKGPDSAGVIELAMRIGAFGVRGNHDDHLLRVWEEFEDRKKKKKTKKFVKEEEEEEDGSRTDDEWEVMNGVEDGDENDTDATNTTTSDGDEVLSSDTADESEDHKKGKGHHEKKDKKTKKNKGKGKKKQKTPKDLAIAKSLKPEQRAWLSKLPLILRLGNLGPRYGEVVVVHAGLVPGIPLESQDPEAVMTMRTLLPASASTSSLSSSSSPSDSQPNNNNNNDQKSLIPTPLDPSSQPTTPHPIPKPMIPTPNRTGIPWAKVWTTYQTSLHTSSSSHNNPPTPIPTTVIYGHDAKSGLRLRRYAFGLDTNCGKDDALTAVVFEFAPSHTVDGDEDKEEEEEVYEDEDEEEEKVEDDDDGKAEKSSRGKRGLRNRIRHRLVSVSCSDGR